MRTDLLLAGVGGQGILTVARILDLAALDEGLELQQAEAHGMSQRGGAVQAHLRIADGPVHGALVPRGRADAILALEPMEGLRALPYLAPGGVMVSQAAANDDTPDAERLLDAIAALPRHVLVPAGRIARAAGSARAQNLVLLGAATPFVGIREAAIARAIERAFSPRGAQAVSLNLAAWRAGIAAGDAYARAIADGASRTEALERAQRPPRAPG